MSQKKKEDFLVKSQLHPRNKHRKRYDFSKLIETTPELSTFVKPNKYKNLSIDFFDPLAVKTLNQALLRHHYGIGYWDIPPNYLCPPIPGRADYIHYIADLLAASNGERIPLGKSIHCLDVGTGANAIYPIIGHHEYGWSFVGSEIDRVAIQSIGNIIAANPVLKDDFTVREQKNEKHIFTGIIQKTDYFDCSICNPPFHASQAEAQAATSRKLRNLKKERAPKPVQNFGGQSKELWYKGGEKRFIEQMILESKEHATAVFWFSTLVSKASSLPHFQNKLNELSATAIKIIPMSQGNKQSRLIAWTFLNTKQQEAWRARRWKRA